MTVPRVSVCVVTYNHERYIYDCIMTVLAQVRDVPLEVLIGDDQSTDRTEEIARALAAQFPDAIRYFRHQNRLGPGGNYQFLIGQARGEYIAHLDGDDFWLPGKLVKQISVMDRDSGISASYTNAICVDDDGVSVGIFNNSQPREFGIDYLFRQGNFLNHSSMVYRSSAKREFVDWPPDFVDYKIHLMLACQGKISYLNCLGLAYRANSATSMIVHQGEKVRALYWQAINEMSKENMASDLRLAASADFLRRILFRSVKVRSLDLLEKWWAIVSTAHHENKVMLALWVIRSTVITAYRELVTRVAARFGGTRLRVIYWR